MLRCRRRGHVKARRGARNYGLAIGILQLDCSLPFIPGDVDNAGTYGYPVLYKVVPGLSTKACLRGAPELAVLLEALGIEVGRRKVAIDLGELVGRELIIWRKMDGSIISSCRRRRLCPGGFLADHRLSLQRVLNPSLSKEIPVSQGRQLKNVAAAISLALASMTGEARAAQCGSTSAGFEAWKRQFADEARTGGIGPTAITALMSTTYSISAIAADRGQRSFGLSLEQFLAKRGGSAIIARGRVLKHWRLAKLVARPPPAAVGVV